MKFPIYSNRLNIRSFPKVCFKKQNWKLLQFSKRFENNKLVNNFKVKLKTNDCSFTNTYSVVSGAKNWLSPYKETQMQKPSSNWLDKYNCIVTLAQKKTNTSIKKTVQTLLCSSLLIPIIYYWRCYFLVFQWVIKHKHKHCLLLRNHFYQKI